MAAALQGVVFNEEEIAGQMVTTLDDGDSLLYIFGSADSIWVISDPLGERAKVEERFPHLVATCAVYGIDMAGEPVPVYLQFAYTFSVAERARALPPQVNLAGTVREMGTGLVVTELMGQGVNTITGDYSRGAAGYWVENGEVAFPVEEITVAANLRDMFRNLVAVGNDDDYSGSVRTGSWLIESMMIAGE